MPSQLLCTHTPFQLFFAHKYYSYFRGLEPLTMTLIYVKDEERTIKSLCALIDKAPKMDVFKLEGTKGDIIVLSKALRRHPCLEEFYMTSFTLADTSLSLDQTVSMILDSVPGLSHIKIEKAPVCCKTRIVPKSGPTDEDAITLTEAVDQSPSIELIDASGNDLPDIGYVAFATAPDNNSSIKTIREGNGKMSGEQRTLVETALRRLAVGRAHAA
jgi:hypothetical protein